MKIYVVIPVHNRLSFTKKCLASLAKQSYEDFEVIVVDDGSTDGTKEYIKKRYPQWQVIRGTGDWWWTKSIYTGVKKTLETSQKGDFVLSMNDDCFFKSNYLKEIVKASVDNKRAIVGSLALDAKRPSRVIGAGVKIHWPSNLIYGVADKISHDLKFYRDRGVIKNIDTLPGRGTLIPVEVFKKIGNFNYRRLPHYIADYEFFCRAKRKGVKLIVSSRARLYNFTKETGSTHIQSSRASYQQILHLLFGRKSKLNVVDYYNFLLLCCPKKHLRRNLMSIVWKIIHFSYKLFPFYYIPLPLYRLRLLRHNLPILIRQNKLMAKTRLFFHNLPILIRQSKQLARLRLFFHNLPIYVKQNPVAIEIKLFLHRTVIKTKQYFKEVF